MTDARTNRKTKNAMAEGRPARPPSKTATNENPAAADGDDEQLINLVAAGKIVGVSRQIIYNHVRAGTIKHHQIGCRLYVTVAEAKRFKSLDRQPGKRKSTEPAAPPKPRGRPRVKPLAEPKPKRPRGRPRRVSPADQPPKRPRGRPRKEL